MLQQHQQPINQILSHHNTKNRESLYLAVNPPLSQSIAFSQAVDRSAIAECSNPIKHPQLTTTYISAAKSHIHIFIHLERFIASEKELED